MHHADRGSQYVGIRYGARLAAAGAEAIALQIVRQDGIAAGR
ncbi:hypothetical protein [Immundisolibacter sp.]